MTKQEYLSAIRGKIRKMPAENRFLRLCSTKNTKDIGNKNTGKARQISCRAFL